MRLNLRDRGTVWYDFLNWWGIVIFNDIKLNFFDVFVIPESISKRFINFLFINYVLYKTLNFSCIWYLMFINFDTISFKVYFMITFNFHAYYIDTKESKYVLLDSYISEFNLLYLPKNVRFLITSSKLKEARARVWLCMWVGGGRSVF